MKRFISAVIFFALSAQSAFCTAPTEQETLQYCYKHRNSDGITYQAGYTYCAQIVPLLEKRYGKQDQPTEDFQ